MAQAQNMRDVGARVEELLAELRTETDPSVAERAEELVCLLVEFYGAGLERVVDLVGREPAGNEIVGRLSQDPLLESLLVLHGLHPVSAQVRIERAVETVKAKGTLGSGEIHFVALDDDGTVHLKLEGSCDGCGSSNAMAKVALEKAIDELIPESTRVVIDGMPSSDARFVTSAAVPVSIGQAPVPVEIGRKPAAGGAR